MPMLQSFLLLCGSTLLGLVVLAAVGAWALWPFRGWQRPYLWVAAPLAGIGTLALSLTVLYEVCRLTLPAAFGVALLVNGAATVVACLRGGLPRGRRRDLLIGLAALLAVAGLCVGVLEGTAVRQGEPTLLVVSGSDHFGYAQVGDWIVRHPHQEPRASAAYPYESYIEMMVDMRERYGAFQLAGLAGWCRGTTTLFSYDFATGVACAAGLLGFAGAFARRPTLLLTLLACAAVSVWLRNASTGYFGKTLAYPGCLLLAALFLWTWQAVTPLRLLACVVLGTGYGLCHSPLTHATAVGLVFIGVSLALVLQRALDRLAGRVRLGDTPQPGPLWKGALIGLTICAPLLLAFADRALGICGQPADPVTTDFMIADALDVGVGWESPTTVGRWRLVLIAGAVVGCGLALLFALSRRAAAAAGLLLCPGVVLAGWLAGKMWHVYQTQGLLYPLALGGAALLVQHRPVSSSRPARLGALALLLCLAGVRIPQLQGTLREILGPVPGRPRFIAQSQIAAVVDRTQGQAVDLCIPELFPCLALHTELGARASPIQYREPSWSVSVGYRHWDMPRYLTCSNYLITPWPGAAASADAFVCANWSVVPNQGVWISQVRAPCGLGEDKQRGYFFWVGSPAAEITLDNGTPDALPVDFVAVAEVPLGPPGQSGRTLLWQMEGQCGQLQMPTFGWSGFRIPLQLPSGRHRLQLRVEQAEGSITLRGAPPDLRLGVGSFALEPRDARQVPSGGEHEAPGG
jgi:hypothetical protein